jgi:hypothetical protein
MTPLVQEKPVQYFSLEEEARMIRATKYVRELYFTAEHEVLAKALRAALAQRSPGPC